MVLHSILEKGVLRNKISMSSEEITQPASNTQQPVLDLSGLRAQILGMPSFRHLLVNTNYSHLFYWAARSPTDTSLADNAAIVFDNPKTYFPTPSLNRNGCKINLPASGYHSVIVKAKTLRTTAHPWYVARAILVNDQVPGTMVVLFGGAYCLTLHEALEALADKSCEMVEKCPHASETSVVRLRLPWRGTDGMECGVAHGSLEWE